MDGWTDFFVAEVGAAAAFAGLLFVGISINLPKILGMGGLPNRALQALIQLLAIFLLASLMLIPGQPPAAVGIELLAGGLVCVLAGTLVGVSVIRQSEAAYRLNAILTLGLFEAGALPYPIGGARILTGHGDGLYWLAAGICISFLKSITDSWVLLVEIDR